MSSATHCQDLKEFSEFLGFAPQNIWYLVANRDLLYTQIYLQKQTRPDAAPRTVNIPCSELKGVQKSILRYILSEFSVSREAHAYVKGRSVVDAAEKMCNKQSILKLDIEDFSPSISSPRIFGLFISLGFNKTISFILTNLTTYEGRLVQGAPTSPYLSNLVTIYMDKDLKKLANKWELNYLRYSDDMFFYGRGYFRYRVFQRYARSVVSDHGFIVNRSKTKYYPPEKSKIIFGLSIQGPKPQLPKKTRRYYRAAFFNASRNLKWGRENYLRLRGMAEWYRAIYGENETYFEFLKILANVRAIMLHEKYKI